MLYGLLLLLVLLAVGTAYFIMRSKARSQVENLAEAMGVEVIHYQGPNAYALKGVAAGFQVTAGPMFLEAGNTEKPIKFLRIDVPLENPNQKYLFISQSLGELAGLQTFRREGAVPVKHEWGDDMEIWADDIWFSSFVLKDEVVEAITQLRKQTSQFLICIQGDALFALTLSNAGAKAALHSLVAIKIALRG